IAGAAFPSAAITSLAFGVSRKAFEPTRNSLPICHKLFLTTDCGSTAFSAAERILIKSPFLASGVAVLFSAAEILSS
ncbi:MAG TPA: hypothetical protein P5282_00005, partial [Anaerolineaceae bacterium]|nr:hypothetical protein [Anaerolineaceae bacterium]